MLYEVCMNRAYSLKKRDYDKICKEIFKNLDSFYRGRKGGQSGLCDVGISSWIFLLLCKLVSASLTPESNPLGICKLWKEMIKSSSNIEKLLFIGPRSLGPICVYDHVHNQWESNEA